MQGPETAETDEIINEQTDLAVMEDTDIHDPDEEELIVSQIEGEIVSAEEKKKSFSDTLKGMWNKVSGGVANTIDKAGNTFEANRIRDEMKKLDARNDELYRQIGESIYRSAASEFRKDEFEEQIREINENFEKQKELLLKEITLSGTDE